ncbi:glycosyltransferase family 2 protein [Leptolyngbya sp. FACHB-261]|uniref:glycosyltransferase family 2 protein n=1 Tax=Leptolyngbya sp. FACHB-261 TaxID=2692806 RepID=UPI001683848F|nr:glycosyltransferase [Leptolyngbya sp. FACHB-261]MBD2101134.1 glycosyltransferase family 2 protein [Leptolyngbya sp. FACHB-261]
MTSRISAVICTLNRAEYLRKAIHSLSQQTLPQEKYEIIVVDNGSTDNTKAVVQEFQSLTNLRYLYEPIKGLSRARNTGWRNASGEYIAYLDDDAVAYPQWLEKIVEAFDTVKPQPGCVGGKVSPIWEAPRPAWMPDSLLKFFTIVDYSEKPITLNSNQWIAGANISFPRHLLEAIGEFQTGLGRTGKKLLSMEENLLQEEIRKRGYHCYYHPEIAVNHHIPASRLTQEWMSRRLYWEGISAAIAKTQRESLSNTIRLKLGVRATRNLLKSPKKLARMSLPADNSERFALKCMALQEVGYIAGMLGVVK